MRFILPVCVGVGVFFLLLVLLSLESGPGTEPPSVASEYRDMKLIDELISCDGPEVWDRDAMISALRERGDEYEDLLRSMLSDCWLSSPNPVGPAPVAPPTRTINELVTDICVDFREWQRIATEKGLDSLELDAILRESGMTDREIHALYHDCT